MHTIFAFEGFLSNIGLIDRDTSYGFQNSLRHADEQLLRRAYMPWQDSSIFRTFHLILSQNLCFVYWLPSSIILKHQHSPRL